LNKQSAVVSNQELGNEAAPPGAERLQPVGQRVFDAILRAIYEQRIRPGTKLGEEALASFFAVGRGHIRRVLLALSHQKVVELIPNRGAFVTRPTEADARDIFSTRRLLEELVIERIITNQNPAAIKLLSEHIRSEATARDNGQRREAVRMAGEFHLTLTRLSGSKVLYGILESVLSQSSLIVSLYGGGLTSSCSVEEHQAIVDAIERGNAVAAKKLMNDHLTHLESTLRLDDYDVDEPDFAYIFGSQ
jgi:DNA-binding GntR family transcriptional regulator